MDYFIHWTSIEHYFSVLINRLHIPCHRWWCLVHQLVFSSLLLNFSRAALWIWLGINHCRGKYHGTLPNSIGFFFWRIWQGTIAFQWRKISLSIFNKPTIFLLTDFTKNLQFQFLNIFYCFCFVFQASLYAKLEASESLVSNLQIQLRELNDNMHSLSVDGGNTHCGNHSNNSSHSNSNDSTSNKFHQAKVMKRKQKV